MSFFDDVINTTKNAAQTAGKKTDEAVRFTKLKIKESQTSSDIKAHFEKLGQMAYEMKKAENPDAALFDAEIEEIDKLDYINLAESIGIDTIINKKLVTASNIFRFTMSTDVQAIKCLTGSEAEVLEFIVKPNAPATKAPIKELKLPQDTIIGGVVRGDKVFIAVGNMELSAYDRVVVFAMPASISKIGYFFN